jgi:hypothetical protein
VIRKRRAKMKLTHKTKKVKHATYARMDQTDETEQEESADVGHDFLGKRHVIGRRSEPLRESRACRILHRLLRGYHVKRSFGYSKQYPSTSNTKRRKSMTQRGDYMKKRRDTDKLVEDGLHEEYGVGSALPRRGHLREKKNKNRKVYPLPRSVVKNRI